MKKLVMIMAMIMVTTMMNAPAKAEEMMTIDEIKNSYEAEIDDLEEYYDEEIKRLEEEIEQLKKDKKKAIADKKAEKKEAVKSAKERKKEEIKEIEKKYEETNVIEKAWNGTKSGIGTIWNKVTGNEKK